MTYQRNFDKRVRVGMVGVGGHAYRNLLPALTFLPVELVAVADVNEELANRTAAQYGIERGYASATEMYADEDLDAVLICVSPQLHPALAIEAFQAGLHVWLEKPAATTVEEVDQMIAARGQLISTVGYKKVFMPAAVKLRELIASGSLGQLHTLLAQYPLSIPLGGSAAENSMWLANGCHPVSLLLSIAGPAAGVTVHRTRDDAGALIIRHENGVLSNLHLSHGAALGQPFERYTVFGQHATAEIDNVRRVTVQRGIPFKYGETTSFAPEGLGSGAIVWEPQDSLNTLENRSEFVQGLYGELNYFLECVLTGRQPHLANLEFARQVAAVHEAALASDNTEIELKDAL
jgi:predicted dehydrogenase